MKKMTFSGVGIQYIICSYSIDLLYQLLLQNATKSITHTIIVIWEKNKYI